MKLIVCVDNQGGVLFNRRRVSSDCYVISDMMEYVGGSRLFVSEYSMKLFPAAEKISIMGDVSDAGADDYVFLEDAISQSMLKQVREVVVYHWNRLYPSDVRFSLEEIRKLGELKSVVEFKGNSHEKITREVYKL